MVASGIPPLAAMLTSLLVFASASMVASAQLLASGTPALLVILTTLFINLRFMMYKRLAARAFRACAALAAAHRLSRRRQRLRADARALCRPSRRSGEARGARCGMFRPQC